MDSLSSYSISLTVVVAVIGGLFGWTSHWLHDTFFFNRKSSTPAHSKASSPLPTTPTKCLVDPIKADEEFVHFMTFPSFPKPCAAKEMYGRCVKPYCRDSHEENNSYKIQKYLMDAKKTVDIAAQAITSHQIADVLEKLAKSGVRVRIIRDYENLSLLKGTEKVSALQRFGVQFKVNGKLDPKDPKTMFVAGIFHHKFMIVDSKVLIHGSGNFTLKAVLQNYECAVATNLPDVVGKFQKHFNDCWRSFDNAILR